jgi:hypothetical protein
MRSGRIDGKALKLEHREGVVLLQVCYGVDSTTRGYIAIPAEPKTLRAVGNAFSDLAKDIERAAEEPDEIVINEYEPDEVVMPEEYLGHSTLGPEGEP